jgi:hypothetical protein
MILNCLIIASRTIILINVYTLSLILNYINDEIIEKIDLIEPPIRISTMVRQQRSYDACCLLSRFSSSLLITTLYTIGSKQLSLSFRAVILFRDVEHSGISSAPGISSIQFRNSVLHQPTRLIRERSSSTQFPPIPFNSGIPCNSGIERN